MRVQQGMICIWRHREVETTKMLTACLQVIFLVLMIDMFELIQRTKEIIGVEVIIEAEVEAEKVSIDGSRLFTHVALSSLSDEYSI